MACGHQRALRLKTNLWLAGSLHYTSACSQ